MTDEIKTDDVVTEETTVTETVQEMKAEESPVVEETKEVEEAPMTEEKTEGVKKEAPMVEEKKEEMVEVEVPQKFKDIVKTIEELSVMELNELVKVFEEKFGVSATAVATGPVAGEAVVAGEEKVKFWCRTYRSWSIKDWSY